MCISIQLQILAQTPHPMALHSHYFQTPIYTGSLSHMHTPALMCNLCMYMDSVCAAEHMKSPHHTPLISKNAHSGY